MSKKTLSSMIHRLMKKTVSRGLLSLPLWAMLITVKHHYWTRFEPQISPRVKRAELRSISGLINSSLNQVNRSRFWIRRAMQPFLKCARAAPKRLILWSSLWPLMTGSCRKRLSRLNMRKPQKHRLSSPSIKWMLTKPIPQKLKRTSCSIMLLPKICRVRHRRFKCLPKKKQVLMT